MMRRAIILHFHHFPSQPRLALLITIPLPSFSSAESSHRGWILLWNLKWEGNQTCRPRQPEMNFHSILHNISQYAQPNFPLFILTRKSFSSFVVRRQLCKFLLNGGIGPSRLRAGLVCHVAMSLEKFNIKIMKEKKNPSDFNRPWPFSIQQSRGHWNAMLWSHKRSAVFAFFLRVYNVFFCLLSFWCFTLEWTLLAFQAISLWIWRSRFLFRSPSRSLFARLCKLVSLHSTAITSVRSFLFHRMIGQTVEAGLSMRKKFAEGWTAFQWKFD